MFLTSGCLKDSIACPWPWNLGSKSLVLDLEAVLGDALVHYNKYHLCSLKQCTQNKILFFCSMLTVYAISILQKMYEHT